MSDRFIKALSSPIAINLIINHHAAFILLSYLCHHARWSHDIDDGLIGGDSIMPGHQKLNMTHKVYRNARQKLIDFGLIEVVYSIHKGKNKNFTKVEKRAIKRAIKSEIVNICTTNVYDLNLKDEGNQKGKQGANKGQHTKKEQESKEQQQRESVVVDIEDFSDGSTQKDSERKTDNVCSGNVNGILRRIPQDIADKYLPPNFDKNIILDAIKNHISVDVIVEKLDYFTNRYKKSPESFTNPCGWFVESLKKDYNFTGTHNE